MLLQYDVKSKYAVWLICSYSILCCVFSKKLFLSCCVINMIIGIQQEAKCLHLIYGKQEVETY